MILQVNNERKWQLLKPVILTAILLTYQISVFMLYYLRDQFLVFLYKSL